MKAFIIVTVVLFAILVAAGLFTFAGLLFAAPAIVIDREPGLSLLVGGLFVGAAFAVAAFTRDTPC